MEKDDRDIFTTKKRHGYFVIMAIAFFVLGFLTNSFAGLDFSATSEGEIGDKALAFITENFLKPQGMDAELIGVEAVGEDLLIVNFTIKSGGGQTQPASVYVTRDGKLILLGQGGGIRDIFEEFTPPEIPIINVSVDDDPFKGPEDARVTIIEFSDFQCPFCKRFRDETLDLILQTYGDDVRFVYRDFPITSLGHAYAQKAAEAAECSDEQGKFWEMHDLLFENQNEMASLQKQVDSPNIEGRTIVSIETARGTFYFDITDDIAKMKEFSQKLGLDTAAFNSCLDSGKYVSEVQKDLQDGQVAGVTGTPAFFINGKKIDGAQPFSVFKQMIDAKLEK